MLQINRAIFRKMEIRTPGQNRQRFMGGITAHPCAEIQGMDRRRKKTEVGSVSVVNEKRDIRRRFCLCGDIRSRFCGKILPRFSSSVEIRARRGVGYTLEVPT